MRDDFNSQVKRILARRVSFWCSNPDCRKPTSGPHTDAMKFVNIGVAAHITAASSNGPRYNVTIDTEQRKAIENGIWLCQDCAKLIDSDEQRYTVASLKKWKSDAETEARQRIEGKGVGSPKHIQDEDIIRFFVEAFDRPAFQDRFVQERSLEAFDKAMEDTITAINTGTLMNRDGIVLATAKGKTFLHSTDYRKKMDVIVGSLRGVRKRYIEGVKSGEIHLGSEYKGDVMYTINNPNLADWFDAERLKVVNVINSLCQSEGILPLTFPIE